MFVTMIGRRKSSSTSCPGLIRRSTGAENVKWHPARGQKSIPFTALFLSFCTLAFAEPNPWRRNDVTLISLCFDSLDRTAPTRLTATEFTDIGSGSATFELVGFTMTDRPVYQISLSHPKHFRAVLVDLPGKQSAAFIAPPSNLSSLIEGWGYVPSPTECTENFRQPALQYKPEFSLKEKMECPVMGINVSFKVDNGPGYNAQRILQNQRA